ncbi:MAG: hypothetical protein EHM35_19835, partial [Planctomycetaceae bacterium]
MDENDMNDENMKLTDLQAEKALLGACITDPDAILKVVDFLQPSDFYDGRNRNVYEALMSLYDEQASIDYLTVMSRLHQTGQENGGGASFLTELVNSAPSSYHAEQYGRIVNRLGTLRRLIETSGKIAKLAYSTSDQLNDVFAKARQMVDAIAPMEADDAVLTWAQSLELFLDGQLARIADEEARDKGGLSARVEFPWKALQRFISYLRPGMLAIIAASSSVGKTAFMECCCEYWARKGLRPVLFHLELNHQLMLDRRMARISGVAIQRIENGYMGPEVDTATAEMKHWKGGITYVHCPGWTAQRITAKARQLQSRGMCDIAVIDYLQKVRLVPIHGMNEASWISNIAETFKIFSEQTGVPVLLGSQFNQEGKKADRKTA